MWRRYESSIGVRFSTGGRTFRLLHGGWLLWRAQSEGWTVVSGHLPTGMSMGKVVDRRRSNQLPSLGGDLVKNVGRC